MTEQEAAETIKAIREVGARLRSDREYARRFFKEAGIVFPPKRKRKSSKTQKKKLCPIINLSR